MNYGNELRWYLIISIIFSLILYFKIFYRFFIWFYGKIWFDYEFYKLKILYICIIDKMLIWFIK